MTRKDMDADLRVAMDAIVNRQIRHGARDGRNEAIVTIVALLAACLMAAMLCHCGGAPFTTADLALSRSDAESPQTQADADADAAGDASASDAVDAHGGAEAATDAGGDVDPRSDDGSAQADAPALYTHHNGIGQTWEDEVPLGTYDLAEATSACVAFTGDASHCGESFCGSDGTRNIVCVSGGAWCWSFLTVDGAVAGHVYNDDAGYRCPGASDPSWQ